MKMVLGFFIGMTCALLLVIAINRDSTPVSADDLPPTPTATDSVEVTGLLPDVGQIYRAALGGPYRQVEKEITDPDIANYFRQYMEDTGLDKVGVK